MTMFFFFVLKLLTMTGLYDWIDGFVHTLGMRGWLTTVFDVSLFAGIVALIVVTATGVFRFVVWTFEDWRTEEGRVPAIFCLFLALVAPFIATFALAVFAIICGVLAGTKGSRLGWVACSLSVAELVATCLLFSVFMPK